jgi:hypothetical protein
MSSALEAKMKTALQKIVGDAGEVLHVTVLEASPLVYSAYFSTEFAALRVYHAYSGSTVFGDRRVMPVEGGRFPGAFNLTNHAG